MARRKAVVAVVTGAVAGLGALSFFAYCAWRFGHWDLYMQTERWGWGVRPDYLALFRPRTYRPVLAFDRLYPTLTRGESGQVIAPVLLGLLCALLVREVWLARQRGDEGWRQRVSLHWGAWLIFYVSVSAMARNHMYSTVRHTYPAYVLMVLVLVHMVSRQPIKGFTRALAWAGVAAVALALNALQAILAGRFTHGWWVA